jgi:acyl-CoA thioester hydrolase
MARFRHTVRVRYSECDPQGVVYFSRYPEYYDHALTELWREAMGPYQSMVDGGADMVVAEMSVRYRAPARFDELIDVDIAVERLGETSMTSAYTVSREGEALVEGTMRHVFIDPATKAKRPIPDDVREALGRFAG